MCFKIIFLGQVDRWYDVCQIDWMLVVEVISWSSRQGVMNLVKWTICNRLVVDEELLHVKLTRYQGTMVYGHGMW